MTLVSEDDHVVPEEMMTAVRSAELKDPRTDDTKVYKDECTYCFKTPFFNDGLFVSMASFHGFCSQHASDYALRTGHSLFLQIESKKVSHDAQPETSRPETGEPNNKISKLTIQDTPKFDIEDSHNLVVYPDFSQKIRISESLGEVLLGACRHVINTTSAERLAMLATSSNAWDAEIKLITKHSNLQQLNNGKTIPFSGWQCEAEGCGIRENLWLNLTDGAIRCGRSQFVSEGKMSEGNGHMQEYYSATGFPLVVKLGTICGQLEAADVYSYDEGDAVIDPNLDKHVAHFGLDATKLQKTEKSTMEMELDMNEKWEWAKCQEDGAALQSIYGPGYTGIVNIGSSCYINSVLQALLQVSDFRTRYGGESAQRIFETTPVEQFHTNFNAQVAKVFSSMLSGEFAREDSIEFNGIKPRQFKRVVAGSHREFSTAKQQDVEEYIRFLLEEITKNTASGSPDPTNAFRFKTWNRFEDVASGKVRYNDHDDVILQLPVSESLISPIEGQENRFRVSMDAVMTSTFAPQVVEGYKSPITGEAKGATNTLRFKTFPDFLLVQVQKFAYTNDGTLKKLDLDFDVQEQLDLSSLRGNGKLENEELLPKDAPVTPPAAMPNYDREIVGQLMMMGFTENASVKAAIEAGSNAESAANWLMTRLDDPTLNEAYVPQAAPAAQSSHGAASDAVDRASLEMIMGLGFTEHQATYALRKNRAVEVATDWLFNHVDEVPAAEERVETAAAPKAATTTTRSEIRDGPGKYRLVGMISHMGSRPDSGHYVAHMLKDEQWILFNDEKVAISQTPPMQLAYIYVYQRV